MKFWESEGDLILQAGDRLFRTQKSKLAAKSRVFQDMFGLPSENSGEDMSAEPVVLFDKPEEIRLLLREIINPSNHWHWRLSFEDFVPIATLSDKYEVTDLLNQCRQKLEIQFTMTLSSFDRFGCTTYPAVGVAILAKRLDWLWVLPMAYYYITQTREGLCDLARGFEEKYPQLALRMEEQDLRSVLHGSMVLSHRAHTNLIQGLALSRCNGCHTRDRCHEGKINLLRGYACNRSGRDRGPDPSANSLPFSSKWLDNAVCDACASASKDMLQETEKRLMERIT